MELVVTLISCRKLIGYSDRIAKVTFRNDFLFTQLYSDCSDIYFREVFRFSLTHPLDNKDLINVQLFDRNKFIPDRFIGQINILLTRLYEKGKLDLEDYLVDKQNHLLRTKFRCEITTKDSKHKIDEDIQEPFNTKVGPPKIKLSKEATVELNTLVAIAKTPETPIEEENFIHLDQDIFDKYRFLDAEDLLSHTFQLQVTIHEAKGLKGNRLNSFCRVYFNGEIKKTEVKKHTNSPLWEALFVFDLMNELKTLNKLILYIKVISDNGAFKRNTIIGIFKIDFLTIFTNPGHTFIKKWIRLFWPVDRTQKTEPQLCGFLRVSLVIVVPSNLHYDTIVINSSTKDGLLLPYEFPTSRNKVAFKLTIFAAHHLNQGTSVVFTNGDLEKRRKLMNPYVKVSFSNNTINSTTKLGDINAIWNESFVIYDIIPPLCRIISIQLFNQNIFGDELVSTVNLDIMDLMSFKLCEFLPTFGPAWINLYGNIANDTHSSKNRYMNESNTLALCYHGRLLISISTSLTDTLIDSNSGNIPLESVEPISEDFEGNKFDMILIFLILNVNMIKTIYNEMDAKILITVGDYGKFGNITLNEKESHITDNMKIDSNLNSNNCYITSNNNKQCLYIKFPWCHDFFRLYQKNLIIKMAINLELNLAQVENSIKVGSENVPDVLIKAIYEVVIGCKRFAKYNLNFKKIKYGFPSTYLDYYLHLKRSSYLLNMQKCCCDMIVSNKIYDNPVFVYQQLICILRTLRNLQKDCQDSIPDIFVWLLIHNIKIAVVRISPEYIIHSSSQYEMGVDCGEAKYYILKHMDKKVQNYNLLENYVSIEGIAWLGPENAKKHFINQFSKDIRKETLNELRNDIISIIEFPGIIKLTLRAHIYLAIDILATDDSGSSDPYIGVFIVNHSAKTEVKFETLCPVWSETLFISGIEYTGLISDINESPPYVTIVLYDMDDENSKEIGKIMAKPYFKASDELYQDPKFPPVLQWYSLKHGNELACKLLCSLELIAHDNDDYNLNLPEDFKEMLSISEAGRKIKIPASIVPQQGQFRFEIFLFGVRSLQSKNKLEIGSVKHFIEFECGEYRYRSSILEEKTKNINFRKQYQYFDVEIPTDENLRPTLSIRILSQRSFNRTNLIGTYSTNSIRHTAVKKPSDKILENNIIYIGTTLEEIGEEDGLVPESSEDKESTEKDENRDENLEWWLNYYSTKTETNVKIQDSASMHTESISATFSKIYMLNNKRPVKIFDEPIENVQYFSGFNDVIETFNLNRGKTGFDSDNESLLVAKFKGKIKLWSFPLLSIVKDSEIGSFNIIPSYESTKVHVRLYVVRAYNLNALDASGFSDPYIVVEAGNTVITDVKNYIPANLNPYFGRIFPLEAEFPRDYLLKVKIYDFDELGADDLIGETEIDIENRYYTKYMASTPLPVEYTQYGAWKWRHYLEPSQMLQNITTLHGLDPPVYRKGECQILNYIFIASPTALDSNGCKVPTNEPAALKALQNIHIIPDIGYHLVPEYIETRPLYIKSKPNISQGYLEMWVEIYPIDSIPTSPPLDISPIKPEKYEIRVIVHSTSEIPLDDVDPITGEQSVDIYVKGWVDGMDNDTQKTDVHKKSLNGDGIFNWRFVFRFDYHKAEKKFVVRKKNNPFGPEIIEMASPILHFEVWNSDIITPDNFIGSLELNVLSMPQPTRNPKACTLEILSGSNTNVLFENRSIRGWYPFSVMDEFDMKIPAGKVELEFSLVNLDDAEKNPVGKAREEPEALTPPVRPDNSLTWLLYPVTILIHLIWIPYKDCILKFFVMILMIAILVLIAYTLPSSISSKLV